MAQGYVARSRPIFCNYILVLLADPAPIRNRCSPHYRKHASLSKKKTRYPRFYFSIGERNVCCAAVIVGLIPSLGAGKRNPRKEREFGGGGRWVRRRDRVHGRARDAAPRRRHVPLRFHITSYHAFRVNICRGF